jgi:hypothetical protein
MIGVEPRTLERMETLFPLPDQVELDVTRALGRALSTPSDVPPRTAIGTLNDERSARHSPTRQPEIASLNKRNPTRPQTRGALPEEFRTSPGACRPKRERQP